MAELQYTITVDENGFIRGIRNSRDTINDLDKDLQKTADRGIQSFSRLEKAIAGAFTVSKIKDFVSQLISVRGEFQQLEIAFTTMLRSKEKSDKLMAELIQFASETPFGLRDAAQAAKQLLAYGSSADTVTDELRMLGDVAAGVSANIGDIVYLYGTLRTQGRAYAVDIRQFAGRGIPIYQELAKVLKVNTNEVNGLVSAGKVGFAEVEQAFKNMTSAAGLFGGLMEKQSASLTGQLEKLSDAWDVMLNKIGESNEGTLYASIGLLADLVENYETVLNVIGALVVTYGSYRAALIVTNALTKLAIIQRTGLTAAEALEYAQLVLLQKAQLAYNAVLAAAPVAAFTALIAALGIAIYSLTQTVNAAEEAHKALAEVQEASEKTVASETRAIEQQISVLNSSTASVEQKKKAYDTLIATTGGVLKGYSQEEIAAGKAKGAIDEYIQSVRKAVQAREAFAQFNKLQEDIDELDRKGADAIGIWGKLGQSLKNTFAPTSQGLSAGEWWEGLFSGDAANKAIVNGVRDAKKTAQDEIKKQFGNIWNQAVTGVPDSDTGPVTHSRTVDIIEAEIKALKEKRDSESTNAKEYIKYQTQINALEKELVSITGKKQGAVKKELSDQKKFLLELAKIEDEISRKSLTDTEEKIQAEKDRFDQLRREAKALGLGEGVTKRINRAESKATGDISYRDDTDKLAIILERQKQEWEKYYAALDAYGQEYAADKYNVQLDYEKKLQESIAPLMKKRLDETITGSEEDRLKKLVDLQDEWGQVQEQREQERYARAYEAAETYGMRIEKIQREYQENVLALGESASAAQLAQLKRSRDEQLSQETSAALRLQTNWEDMFTNLFAMGQKSARDWLKQSRDRIEVARLEGKLTPQEYKKMMGEVEGATNDLNLRNPFAGFGDALTTYRKNLVEAKQAQIAYNNTVEKYGKDSDKAKDAQKRLEEAQEKTKKSFKELADVAGEWAAIASQAVGDLAQSFQTLGIGGEELQNTLGKVQNVLTGISQLAKGVASGDAGSIIGGAIKTLTSVISLFNTKDKRLQKQIDGYATALKALGYQYDQLQRKIDNSVGKSYYDDSEAAISNLQTQIKNLAASRDAESSKKKKDQSAIDGYNEAITNAQYAIEDLQRSISEELLQTNFKQLSDNLANALLSAFEAGEDGIKSMNDTFDQFIKNAVANSLKLAIIEPLMKQITEDVTKYMLANNESVAGYNFDQWKDEINEAGKEFNKGLEDAYKGFGLEKNGDTSTPNSLSGAIKGASQESIDLLAGQMGGVRLSLLDMLAVSKSQYKVLSSCESYAMQNLNTALQIERNTRRTAEATEGGLPYLETIANNTKDNIGLQLRAAGKFGY